MSRIKIKEVNIDFIRERLANPFGFKGKYLDELWQAVCSVESGNFKAVCPSTQSVLWSDGAVFGSNSPAGSNALMLAVTQRAANMIKGIEFERPDILIGEIVPELNKYADTLCGFRVRRTFVLNALVGIDIALWSLYALENGIASFDGIIPSYAKESMSSRHESVAHIPLISYGVQPAEIKKILDSGTAVLKIKIGANVDSSTYENDMKSMLEQDKKRLYEIHNIAKEYTSKLTKNNQIAYYLDANGRYDTISRLESLLDYAAKIGCLENICLLEEPFGEENHVYVGDLPVVVNADESAHSLEDVRERLELGYKAVALKPIAKTLSVSFNMASAVYGSGGSCLCADLTVNPLLAEWNKQFAARISALSSLNAGCVEVNGDQSYTNWDEQKTLLPAGYIYNDVKNGAFYCGDKFYNKSGNLFLENGYFKIFYR